MSNLPEPADPVSHIRASDADRDRVVRIVGEALADGRLSPQEHSDRLDAIYDARTIGELAPITHDLPAVPHEHAGAPAPRSSVFVDPAGASSDTDKMIGILGGGQRKGRWRVRRRTKAVMVLGGFELDMTELTFDAPVVEIKLFALLGGLHLVVPEGVEVRNHCGNILGGVNVDTGGGPAVPGAPVIVLKGLLFLGGVDVKARKGSRRLES